MEDEVPILRLGLNGRIAGKIRRRLQRAREDIRYAVHRKRLAVPVKSLRSTHVAVVGGGIAGLATAYRLEQSGHKVTILEASTQCGGRVATIREPFADGLYIDAGGFRFATDHFLVRDYINLFGLEYSPFFPSKGEMILYLNKQLIRRRASERINPDWLTRQLTEEEKWILSQETDLHTFHILGGVDRLVSGFLERIATEPLLYSKVKSIEQDTDGVTVCFSRNGSDESISADHAVCALPASVLKNVKFSPELPSDKQALISSLKYRNAMLIYFQLPSEYWHEQNLTGFGITDTVGEIWTPGLKTDSNSCITITYTKDDAALELLNMSQEERIAITIQRCNEFLPWFGDFVRERVALSWDEDDLIGGSFSTACFLPPQQMATMRRAEGKIHFAGEHVGTDHHGWMEGAMESAHRVADEISADFAEGPRTTLDKDQPS